MLEFILIFFALIYLLRKLAPWILRFFISRFFVKVKEQQSQHQKNQYSSKTNPNKTKSSSEDLGEYIDYEEID